MSVSQALQPGVVLGREFEIVRLLRAGGMGAVYEAVQRTTGAPRAVKVMRSALASDARFRARFEQEARVSARIPSDHVVQVVSAGVDETTHAPWLAMELLDGDDLGDWLLRNGRMSIPDARLAIGQLVHALAAAHEVGVVHRDLKPENVFLGRSRVVGVPFMVKVLDFGVAKILSEARVATIAVGTPFYMAPEQTQPSADVGPTADVWALGLLVYQVLTGRQLWKAAASEHAGLAQLWREVLIDPIPIASERASEQGVGALVPEGLDLWLARCVAREPGERFPDAAAAYAELAPILDAAIDPERAKSVTTGAPLGVRVDAPTMSATSLHAQGLLGASLGRVERARSRVTFREGGERLIVEADRGALLLDVSLGSGVPHYHACRGKARCTTCRVVVLEGAQNAGSRTEAEARVAAARRWPESIRLACQLRVLGDLTVRRLVVDSGDAATVSALHTTQEPTSERAAVAMISILGFDAFARQQFAHDVVHVLNRYLGEIIEPVIANRGRVLRYTHTGVMVAFGGPGLSDEVLALDATRAALRVGARVRQLNPYTLKHFGHEFDVAVGLELGELLHAEVGHEARVEMLAFGEAVDGATVAASRAASEGARIAAGRGLVGALGDRLRTGRALGEDGRMVEVFDFAKPDVVFLVQSTFEQLGSRTDAVARFFYARLFELYPPAAPLFEHTDMDKQRGMLMDVLATAVRGLDRLDDLVPILQDLGRRHVGYGVEPLHYKYVGRALLEALEHFLAEDFTAEVHLAWMEIYGIMARTMIDAASESAAPA